MIYIASDHAGFTLKGQLIEYLKSKGQQVEDCGPSAYDEGDDYPDLVAPCAQKVANDNGSHGIIVGGSGQGEAIAANKIKGIRAVLYYGGNLEIIRLSRRHNNANVLSLGARFVRPDEAKQAVDAWLSTEFEGGRHQRRVEKISELEAGS
jgi:ribose 5-phosphate isomerase B